MKQLLMILTLSGTLILGYTGGCNEPAASDNLVDCSHEVVVDQTDDTGWSLVEVYGDLYEVKMEGLKEGPPPTEVGVEICHRLLSEKKIYIRRQ